MCVLPNRVGCRAPIQQQAPRLGLTDRITKTRTRTPWNSRDKVLPGPPSPYIASDKEVGGAWIRGYISPHLAPPHSPPIPHLISPLTPSSLTLPTRPLHSSLQPSQPSVHTHARTHTHAHTHTCTHALTPVHTHSRIRTRTRTHTHTYTHINTHSHKYTRIQSEFIVSSFQPSQPSVHTHACMHTHTHALTHVHTHSHLYTRTHARTHTHTHTHTHTYTHIYSHKHTHIHIVYCVRDLIPILQSQPSSSGHGNHASQRRLASVFSSGDISSDLAKYNQLRVGGVWGRGLWERVGVSGARKVVAPPLTPSHPPSSGLQEAAQVFKVHHLQLGAVCNRGHI